MAQALLNLPAKIKLVTASCREIHTASNLKEPSGVCQLTLGRILNLHKQSGSNSLGHWSWQEFCIDGPHTLYVITAYRVCPQPQPLVNLALHGTNNIMALSRKVYVIPILDNASSSTYTNSLMKSNSVVPNTLSDGMPIPPMTMMRFLISSRILT